MNRAQPVPRLGFASRLVPWPSAKDQDQDRTGHRSSRPASEWLGTSGQDSCPRSPPSVKYAQNTNPAKSICERSRLLLQPVVMPFQVRHVSQTSATGVV